VQKERENVGASKEMRKREESFYLNNLFKE